MANKSHVFHFGSEEQGDSVEEDHLETTMEQINIKEAEIINIRTEPDHPDIADLVQKNETLTHLRSGSILSWLKRAHHQSRGFELGTFDAPLLAVTMKQQSLKWRTLALEHVSDIITMVHSFVRDLFTHSTPSEAVRIGIESLLMDELTRRYQTAMSHVQFLLDVELDGNPATHNHYNETLRKWIVFAAFSDCTHGEVVRKDNIVENHPLSNTDHAIQEIHDILKSYYKVARKRFVDSVRMQVADHFLVTGLDTPLTLRHKHDS